MLNPYEYQRQPIEHLTGLLSKGQNAANGSDTGTGKTLVAVEVMKRLGNPATLVVSPKGVLPTWHRTAVMQGTELDAINYEMLRTGRTPYGIWRVPKGCIKPRFCYSKGIELLLLDEAHRCKGMDTDNAELMRAARRQGIPTIAMSATLADSPLEMDALGFLLGMHDGQVKPTLKNPDPYPFYNWARKHGCGPGGFSQFAFTANEADRVKHMAKIHAAMYPAHGVRVRIKDLGDAFPDTQITAELYGLDEPGRIDSLYAEMATALALLKDKAAADKAPEHPMTALLRARQQVELLKVPVFVELTKDAIDQGHTVLLFVNFRQTLLELCNRLNTDCFIDGTQTGPSGARRREENRLRVQRDESRVLVGISDAAGVGLDLHDITGKYSRMSLISAGYNAKLVRQLVGRPWRAGALSKSFSRFIFADGTVEVEMHSKLSSKLNNLDALNDGDLSPENLQVTRRF